MIFKRTAPSRVIGILLLSTLFACSSGNTKTSSTETLTPTPTIEKDAQIELENLAVQSGALDFSRISESNCGEFGLIVEPTRIKFFEWTNNLWLDRSELLGNESGMDPYRVTTRDYTGDAIFEFLVSYDEGGKSSGREFGAVFMQISCDWQWAKLRGFQGAKRAMDYLEYEKSSDSLIAIDYGVNGRDKVTLLFNSKLNEFESSGLVALNANTRVRPPTSTTTATKAKNRSASCVSLRQIFIQASQTSDPYIFESEMNDAVYVLRQVGWGVTADFIARQTIRGMWQSALGGITNYLNAYDCE